MAASPAQRLPAFPPAARIDDSWRPEILDPHDHDDTRRIADLIASGAVSFVHDTFAEQVRELLVIRATRRLDEHDLDAAVRAYFEDEDPRACGRWIYYPWSRRLVHLLAEPEFIEVRFNRNQYKITPEEQASLRQRTIAVAGLSVGQSAAVTLVMEGVGGRFRIADFDELGLSNLNRLRAGVHQLGVNKAILASREMYEIDPYVDISIFPDGLTEDNVDAFFDDGPKLDLLVEECDDLYMKVRLREHARARGVPVIMDTSDRGLIDVERFDLEPDRPLFHDIIGNLDAQQLAGLPTKEKIPFVLNLLDAREMSIPFAGSLLEIEQSIYTWPQLASGVTLGGALVTDAARRMLLGTFDASGRFYVDIDRLVANGAQVETPHVDSLEPEACAEARAPRQAPPKPSRTGERAPTHEEVRYMVGLAVLAPSGGNGQPWDFAYDGEALQCGIALERSGTFLDFEGYASTFAIGAAIENLDVAARSIGWACEVEVHPESSPTVCTVRFARSPNAEIRPHLAVITQRATNRRLSPSQPIADDDARALQQLATASNGTLPLFGDPEVRAAFGRVLGKGDRIRYLSQRMHHDLMSELRWDPASVVATRTGIDLPSLELPAPDAAGLRVLSSWPTMEFVGRLGGGQALTSHAHKAVELCSAVGRLSLPGSGREAYFEGGRVMQRIWLEATLRGLSLQPYSAFLFLLARLEAAPETLDASSRSALEEVREDYRRLVSTPHAHTEILFFRLSHAGPPTTRSLRLALDRVLKFGP